MTRQYTYREVRDAETHAIERLREHRISVTAEILALEEQRDELERTRDAVRLEVADELARWHRLHDIANAILTEITADQPRTHTTHPDTDQRRSRTS